MSALLIIPADVSAQETLPQIDIGDSQAASSGNAGDGTKRDTVIGAPAGSPSTTYTVNPQGIDLATGGGGSNPIRAISYLPSVDAPAIDPYGLANLPGGSKGLRIRGELSQHGNSTTLVDGLPVSAVNPGPGITWLIDNENLDRIVLYQGPTPSTVNSYFTLPGVIDSQLRWPAQKAGGEISQSVGSSSFLRTFARVDTGEILNGTTKVFVSGSWTDADLWRGVGKDPQGKAGFALGLDTKPVDAFEAKLFVAKSSFNQNSYAGLNYVQASNLGYFRWYNFQPTSSNLPALAVNYYGYNQQSFDSWTALSEFTVHVNDSTRIVVKPYYFREDGYYLDGMGNGMVRKWLIDHDNYGVTSELQTHLLDTDITIGHWYGVQNLPGPPTAWTIFKPNAAGTLTNAAWPILAQQTSPHIFNAAYGVANRDFGRLHMQAGVRYIWERLAGIDEHNSAGIGDIPYSLALALSPTIIPNRSVTGFTVGTFLPYGSLAYDVTDNVQLKVSAGGGYGGPSYDVWPAYQQNFAAFSKYGVTANQAWHALKPETSAMVDAGLRWSFAESFGSGYVEPLFYYSRNHNKSVVYDPGIGVAFGQNNGESESYGGQALAHYSPVENLDLFASLGYQRAVFTQDLQTLPGAPRATVLSAKVTGKQLPDVPYWISTIGGSWRFYEFTFTPIVHIVSTRSGDTSGLQPIAGYATVDLNLSYEHKLDWATLTASVSVMNLFDQAYIGQISNGYYQQTSSSGIYFPGAPRTVLAKVGMKF